MTTPLSLLAAGLWLAFAQAAPAAPAVQQVPAAVGKCMWEKFPAEARTAILAKPTIDAVFEELNVRIVAIGNSGMLPIGRACGVGMGHYNAAGSRVSDWAGRLWAEKQLAGRVTPQKLDQVFRAMPAADKQTIYQSLNIEGGLNKSPGKEPVDRFLAPLGIRRTEQAAYIAAINYLISRLNDEK